jgi:hypothetical protein
LDQQQSPIHCTGQDTAGQAFYHAFNAAGAPYLSQAGNIV